MSSLNPLTPSIGATTPSNIPSFKVIFPTLPLKLNASFKFFNASAKASSFASNKVVVTEDSFSNTSSE